MCEKLRKLLGRNSWRISRLFLRSLTMMFCSDRYGTSPA